MNISGPFPVARVNASQSQELDLHPFQRVTAQVLAVTGTTAILSIDGYPIVAQLDSTDQAATLLPQQTEKFMVTQRTEDNITLKVINNNEAPATTTQSPSPGLDLAGRLLEQLKMPVTATHLAVVRALLKNRLPVDAAQVNDALGALSSFGSSGQKETELAVALKAAGLPLNTQSLVLASRQATQMGDSLIRLLAKLTAMTKQDLSEDLLKELQSKLQLLNTLLLKADGDTSYIAKQLRTAIALLGQSIENALLQRAQNATVRSRNDVLDLARLQQRLEQAGKYDLAKAIEEFLKDLQVSQFWNAEPDSAPSQGQWAEIGLGVQNINRKIEKEYSSARLRISREPGEGKINPASTRLILQVDISPDQTIEVDLSIVRKLIRTTVSGPDPAWCRQAQAELPSLEKKLQTLGFTLKDTQVAVVTVQPFEQVTTVSNLSLMTVDIEV